MELSIEICVTRLAGYPNREPGQTCFPDPNINVQNQSLMNRYWKSRLFCEILIILGAVLRIRTQVHLPDRQYFGLSDSPFLGSLAPASVLTKLDDTAHQKTAGRWLTV